MLACEGGTPRGGMCRGHFPTKTWVRLPEPGCTHCWCEGPATPGLLTLLLTLLPPPGKVPVPKASIRHSLHSPWPLLPQRPPVPKAFILHSLHPHGLYSPGCAVWLLGHATPAGLPPHVGMSFSHILLPSHIISSRVPDAQSHSIGHRAQPHSCP